ncbi:MAG: hypothetical protein WCF98_06975 [Synechococcus sp. ELA057]
MAKEEGSRAEELRSLGWSAEEVRTYEELWEYRQRWGAINLEREERQLLRRAEAALPKRLSGKAAQRKSIRDKNHYRWLSRHLEALQARETTLKPGEVGAWTILLDEELRALRYYQPVLGLPDTLKAKAFEAERERWAAEAAAAGRVIEHDFSAAAPTADGAPIRPLRGEPFADNRDYPVLDAAAAAPFRARVRQEICGFTRATYPSLKDSDKPEPPDDWEGI